MNKTKQTLDHLERMVGTLRTDQGRIARRNARRRVLGAVRQLRNAIDAEYPTIAKEQPKIDPVDTAATKMKWRQFEDRVIKHVQREFDIDLAREFNEYVCSICGHQPKAISLSMRSDAQIYGIHDTQQIRLNRRQADDECWKTLLHEIAHYRVRGHRRQFVTELARVYKLWKQFLQSKRVAARRRD